MSRRRTLAACTAGLVAVALALAGIPACGGRHRPAVATGRTVVFGIDGADWDRALPLMRQGKMPVLARLVRTGASRTLRSLPPLPDGTEWLSPSIWTTVATGVVPERHGIHNFVSGAPGALQPVTSNQRRTAALWNMATARGIRVGVVGWMVTWPAEAVDGYVVSSYSPYVLQWGQDPANRPIKGTLVPGIPNQIWPAELESRLEPVKVPPDSVSAAEIERLFTGRPIPDAPGDDAARSLEGLRWSWASDRTYERAVLDLARNPPGGARPPLEMLYFGSVDVVSHRFWKYGEPSTHRFGRVADADVEAYGQAVESAYRSVDGILGRVLAAETDSSRWIVLSDHGFRENRDPRRNSSGWHRPQGLLVASGPGFRRGERLPPGSVIDVAPTVLYSLGLPVADDFDGDAALDLFTPTFRDAHALERIASWEPETERTRSEAPVASPVDEEILRRLRSLGYID